MRMRGSMYADESCAGNIRYYTIR